MLSIVVCSRNKYLRKEFVDNITNTIGVDYELIHVDNSENKYSIFSAYNSGFARSKFPYWCFLHEDVKFHSTDWGVKIIEHLSDTQTGIIGLAGADLVHRVPCAWSQVFSPSQNILQTDPTGKNPPEHLLEPTNYAEDKRTSVTIDGIMLCMRSQLMTDVVKFDENLSGFHGYDYDISLQSYVAGYQNYVIYDIKVEHFSGGKTNRFYFKNLISIYKKYEKYLPIVGKSVTDEERAKIDKLEQKNLNQLIRKMVRKGFEVAEIKTEIGYFAKLIGYKKATVCLTIRIFLIRIFNAPKFLLKSNRVVAQLN
jgi:hypothetical protein